MTTLECIKKRKSIRKFQNQPVPKQAILTCLEAATEAPSPKHQQNWYFAVVQDKAMIGEIAETVATSHERIGECCKSEEEKKHFMKFMKYYTLFKEAPVVVLVYAKPYEMIEEKILRASGEAEAVIDQLKSPQSAAQAIGAAVENFLLAATELGYGTCYMTGPTHAKAEIEALTSHQVPSEYELMSLIAMGVAEENSYPKPSRVPLEQVVTFID